MIITAIGLVVMLAVIVAAVVMRQSGQNTAKESDRSEQTATDPTSLDDNMPFKASSDQKDDTSRDSGKNDSDNKIRNKDSDSKDFDSKDSGNKDSAVKITIA